jgi:hypothetical protein
VTLVLAARRAVLAWQATAPWSEVSSAVPSSAVPSSAVPSSAVPEQLLAAVHDLSDALGSLGGARDDG